MTSADFSLSNKIVLIGVLSTCGVFTKMFEYWTLLLLLAKFGISHPHAFDMAACRASYIAVLTVEILRTRLSASEPRRPQSGHDLPERHLQTL